MGMRSHQPGGSLQFPWTGFVIQSICAVVFWLRKSPACSGPNIERRQLDLYDPSPLVRLLNVCKSLPESDTERAATDNAGIVTNNVLDYIINPEHLSYPTFSGLPKPYDTFPNTSGQTVPTPYQESKKPYRS